MYNNLRLAVAAGFLFSNALLIDSFAQTIVIDGTKDVGYGSALAVQDTATGFGDNSLSDGANANGSELDAAYATVEGGNLNLLLTGNLETNFNRIYLFFDTTSGGQNTLSASSGIFNEITGLKFDSGFNADFGLVVNGNNTSTFADFETVGGSTTFLGSSVPGSGNGILTGGSDNGVKMVLNNSNTAGVTGAGNSGAGAVTTGLEFLIPLSLIGSPASNFNVTAFIAGSGSNAVISNQLLGGAGGASNLGNASTVDFSTVSGTNSFSVVPEPGSLSLCLTACALGGAVLTIRKARRVR